MFKSYLTRIGTILLVLTNIAQADASMCVDLFDSTNLLARTARDPNKYKTYGGQFHEFSRIDRSIFEFFPHEISLMASGEIASTPKSIDDIEQIYEILKIKAVEFKSNEIIFARIKSIFEANKNIFYVASNVKENISPDVLLKPELQLPIIEMIFERAELLNEYRLGIKLKNNYTIEALNKIIKLIDAIDYKFQYYGIFLKDNTQSEFGSAYRSSLSENNTNKIVLEQN